VAATTSHGVGELGEAFAMPVPSDSEPYVLRGLAALADHDVQREHIIRIVRRAGVDLKPLAASLLVRLDAHPDADAEVLGRARGAGVEETRAALAELRDRGLITQETGDGTASHWRLTRAGCQVLTKLIAARRAHLEELFAEWGPGRREELAAVLHRLADELVPDVKTKVPA
jgi:DNA-binding MarR family transcriptional regulator